MIEQILEKYPNDVKVVVKHFPLSFHKQAFPASKYALAAIEQGKYKEMFHMIFCGKAELPKYPNGQAPQKNECEAWRKLKDNENLPLEYGLEV